MQYTYRIELDLERDLWNWYDVSREPVFQGFDWRDNLADDPRCLEIFNKAAGLPEQAAKEYLYAELQKLYQEWRAGIADYTAWLEQEFANKFQDACVCLEKLTGQPPAFQRYGIWLTTFPRCPYFYDREGEDVGMVFNIVPVGSGDPIAGFLHEVLHFQFLYYWRDNPKSPVHRLADEDFHYLKEALTVVIDDELKPLITDPDRGYPAHHSLRELLHAEWRRHHDFGKLVEFGLEHLDTPQE